MLKTPHSGSSSVLSTVWRMPVQAAGKLGQLLIHNDWRCRHAALICLAQIAEGCNKVLGTQLHGLVDMCLKVGPVSCGLCCSLPQLCHGCLRAVSRSRQWVWPACRGSRDCRLGGPCTACWHAQAHPIMRSLAQACSTTDRALETVAGQLALCCCRADREHALCRGWQTHMPRCGGRPARPWARCAPTWGPSCRRRSTRASCPPCSAPWRTLGSPACRAMRPLPWSTLQRTAKR